MKNFWHLGFLLILLSSIWFKASSQEKPKNYTLNGYIKDLQTIILTNPDKAWTTDNMLHNRLNFKWYMSPKFTLTAEMRNRFVWGEMLTYESLIPDSLQMFKYSESIEAETGFIDASFTLAKGTSYLLHSTFDRFYLDYTAGKFQMRVGRQRINWAQTFAFNPNDLFNNYSFFDFDYEEKPGSDAVKLTYYTGLSSQLEFAAKLDYKDRLTAAGMYRFNKWGYDIQFIGGYLNDEDWVIGGGWSGSFFKGGLRGEFSYFHPKDGFKDSSGVFVAAIGYDYTFPNALMIQGEALYKSDGLTGGNFNVQDFYFMDLSAKNLSISQWTFVLSGNYPISPLLSASLSAMYAPSPEFFFVGPTLSYSLNDNLDFSFTGQSFFSGSDSGKGTYIFLRLKQSF